MKRSLTKRWAALIAVLVFALTAAAPLSALAAPAASGSVEASPTSLTMKLGETLDLSTEVTLTVKDAEGATLAADDYTATYAVKAAAGKAAGDPISLDGSTVTADNVGEGTVTITVNDKGETPALIGTADVKITVEPPELTVTAPATLVYPQDLSSVEFTAALDPAVDGATFEATATPGTITATFDEGTATLDWGTAPTDASTSVSVVVTAKNGGTELATKTVTITVKKAELKLTGPSTVTVGVESTTALEATLDPEVPGVAAGALEATYTAGGSPGAVTVAEDKVTGTTAGAATITATATVNGVELTSDPLEVTVEPLTFTLSTDATASVKADETVDVTATLEASDPDFDMSGMTAPTYTWTIESGVDVVSIDPTNALTTTVTGKKAGTAVLQLVATGGDPAVGSDCKATVTVTVTDSTEESPAPSDDASPSPDASASASSSASESASSAPTLPPASDSGAASPSTPGSSATSEPSAAPSAAPSSSASSEPSSEPSGSASAEPSGSESAAPSGEPSGAPSGAPTSEPNTPADEVPIEPAEDAPIEFEVSDNPDGSGSVLTGIDVATDNTQTAANAVENLIDSMQVPEGQTVEVVDKDGEPVPMGDPVATGMIVQVVDTDGNVVSTTAVVVKGDVMGTGEMNLTQLVRLASAFVGDEPLTGAYLMAGDLAGDDGVITLTDLVRMAALYKTFTEGE